MQSALVVSPQEAFASAVNAPQPQSEASGAASPSGQEPQQQSGQSASPPPAPASPPSSSGQQQNSPPASNPKSAPGAQAPSLSDLGLTPNQTQGNAQQQALLDKRTHMLKAHQRLGLITLIPLAATVVSSGSAGGGHGKLADSTGRDVHAALGGVSVGMYAATAYYAIAAPRVPGTPSRGAIRLHRALAWVHGPGMVLTPILGIMAFNQENNGQKVHGLASAHGPVADATIIAYAAAILSVSWPIKF